MDTGAQGAPDEGMRGRADREDGDGDGGRVQPQDGDSDRDTHTPVTEPVDESYPPDDDEDAPGQHVPEPRAQRVRGAMQARPGKAKAQRRLVKGSSRIMVQEKRRKALELRKAGATYDQIAQAVGYKDSGGARKAVLKGFGEVIQEPVAELRTMQIERLNHMLMVLWPKVQTGDTVAINTSLSVMNKIDALMGTEAARQIEVKNDHAVLVIDGNKEDYIAALKKMAGAGVNPDGTNMTAQQVPQALPSGQPATPPSRYPPGMGPQEDVVDAELVEETLPEVFGGEEHPPDVQMSDCTSPLGTVCKDPACPLHFGQGRTKKKFNFGVDPTVQRKKGA